MTAEHLAHVSKKMPTPHRIAIIASALALAGCPRTVSAPAIELPSLSPKVVARSLDWPTVMTRSGGTQKIQGTIDGIRIIHARGSDPIDLRFKAEIEGHELLVKDSKGPRAYSLAEQPHIEIDYGDLKAARVGGGIALFGLGIPLMIGGVAAFIETVELADGPGLEPVGVPLFGLMAVVLTGSGLSALGGGIYYLATDPKKELANAAMVPRVRVGPQGVALSFKF
jgi:hypothetical protein